MFQFDVKPLKINFDVKPFRLIFFSVRRLKNKNYTERD